MQDMTYGESAQGVIITHQRALLELADHGIDIYDPREVAEFDEFMGGRCGTYDAGRVLEYLGY